MTCPGPCSICGARNYELSLGGPNICPPCDCGTPPMDQVKKLREQVAQAEPIRAALRRALAALYDVEKLRRTEVLAAIEQAERALDETPEDEGLDNLIVR